MLTETADFRPSNPVRTRTGKSDRLLVGIMLLAGAFGLFEWELSHGESLIAARTVAVNVFVFGGLFYLFNCRSLRYSMFHVGVFSNLWVLFGVSSMAALQVLFTYWPPMNRLFHSGPIGHDEWLLILSVGLAIHAAVGLEKWIGRRWLSAR